MATYGNSIYQYDNPTQVDISMLGKAVQFKQENYDANTTNVQNLVNQYLNMDLARDVDKDYLGGRLQTLVNYVNGSGQKDWSRANIARDVSNYVGGAIDSNVTRAVASTKMYRKQQEEIQALKIKNPELYNQANEWKATQDWNRYATSGQLGDMYRPQSYTNYVDVNKRVMEMAPKLLKDFGVQIVYNEEAGSTPMFRRIGKHEIITGDEASKFTNMVLGDDGRSQLAINSQYKNQGLTDNDISDKYSSYLDAKVDVLNSQKSRMIASKGGANQVDKKTIDTNISKIDAMISNLKTSALSKTNRDSMLYNMEIDNFVSGWGDFLSYDKTVSVDIDDSGYKTEKFNFDVRQATINNQFKEDELALKAMTSQRDYELALAKAMGDGSVTIGSDGKPVANTGGLNANGVTTTESVNTDVEEQEYTVENVKNEYSNAYNSALESFNSDFNDPTKRKALEKEFGSLVGMSSKDAIVNFIVGANGNVSEAQAKLANAQRKGLISSQTANAIRNAQEKFIPWKEANDTFKKLETDLANIGYKTIDNMKGKTMYGFSDVYIDENGITREGDFLLKTGTDRKEFNEYQKIGAKLTTALATLRDGNLSKANEAILKGTMENLISRLPKQHQDKAREYYSYTGNFASSAWSDVTAGLGEIGSRISGAWNKYVLKDSKSAKESYDNVEKYKRQQSIARRDGNAFFNDLVNRSYDLDDGGTNEKINLKVKGEQTSVLNYIDTNIINYLDNTNKKLQTYKPTASLNKNINVDTSLKTNKYAESIAKAYMPDSQIVSGGNISFNIGSDGSVSMTAPVKDGKEITTRTEVIPMSALPANLTQNLRIDSNSSYDVNGGKMGYSWSSEILPTKKKVYEEFGDVVSNPTAEGILSKEDILDIAEKTYGKKFVTENKKVLDDIVDKGVNMDAKVVNGSYVLDITNGSYVERRPLQTTNLGENMDLLTMQKDKIASEIILKNINQTFNKLKN